MAARKITRELLKNLPSEMHRLVAVECFIMTGQWILVDQISPEEYQQYNIENPGATPAGKPPSNHVEPTPESS